MNTIRKIILCCLVFISSNSLYSEDNTYIPFSNINDLNLFIDEDDYKDCQQEMIEEIYHRNYKRKADNLSIILRYSPHYISLSYINVKRNTCFLSVFTKEHLVL